MLDYKNMKKVCNFEFKINKLDCIQCSQEILQKVNAIEGVEADIDMSTSILYAKMEHDKEEQIKEEIKKIIRRVNCELNLSQVFFVKGRKAVVKSKKEIKDATDYIYTIENLGCPSCASKIERKINSYPTVERAVVDLVSNRLYIRMDSSKVEETMKKVASDSDAIEPGIRFKTFEKLTKEQEKEQEKNEDKKYKNEVLRLALALGVFASGFFIKNETAKLLVMLSSYFIAGYSIVISAFKNIFKGDFLDENFLVTIASVGAFAIGESSEAVAVMLFFAVGEFMQSIAVSRSKRSIKALMDIRADYANVVSGEEVIKKSPEDVKLGDIIIIRPGEKVPLDAVVTKGQTSMDTRALTGESKPQKIGVNDKIYSGAINKEGLIEARVTSVFAESTVSKILELMETASAKKATTENFITVFAKYYTPVVVGLAVCVGIIPPLLNMGNFHDWIYKACMFLVLSCPCALVISVPLSYFAGIGGGSKNNILVKGGNFLDSLKNVKKVVFDKTGTLTKGVFSVEKIVAKGISEDELCEIAASVEKESNHPIAVSIKEYYKKDIKTKVLDIKEVSGMGLVAQTDKGVVLLGNDKLLEKEKISYQKEENASTIVYIALNGKYIGNIQIRDILKDDSKELIAKLKKMNIKTYMLTGDNETEAKYFADMLGIDKYYGGLLPHQKVERLEDILKTVENKNDFVAFVGDGINDAPSLMRADVGIAMGELGSDAAIEACDVIIMGDKMTRIYDALRLGKFTKRVVIQNIVLALGTKIVVLVLGLLGIANMWLAIFADVGISIIAILNALRALRFK